MGTFFIIATKYQIFSSSLDSQQDSAPTCNGTHQAASQQT
jgi:hypothetical protein